jgi:hypothetical protein
MKKEIEIMMHDAGKDMKGVFLYYSFFAAKV